MSAGHTRARRWRRDLVALAAGRLFAMVWGWVTQTQFNLQALALGVPVPLGQRAMTMLQDLAGFSRRRRHPGSGSLVGPALAGGAHRLFGVLPALASPQL